MTRWARPVPASLQPQQGKDMTGIKEELRKDIENRINGRNQLLKEIDEEFEVLASRQERTHKEINELRGILHSIVNATAVTLSPIKKNRSPKDAPSNEEIRNWIQQVKKFTQKDFLANFGYSPTSGVVFEKRMEPFITQGMVRIHRSVGRGRPHVYEYKKP